MHITDNDDSIHAKTSIDFMGSRLVQDINPAGSSSPNELISINGLLFFSAELEEANTPSETSNEGDDNTDSESSDDTGESTESTSEAEPESSPAPASAGTVGLMRSDGTNEGTNILAKFDSVTNLVNAGNELYFIAGVNNQYQLWRSDGTTRGTKPVKDLYPNADPNFSQDLFEIDGVLFYSAIDATGEDGKYPYVNGYEVWRKEGKGVGSRFFRNLIPDKIITEIEIEDDDDENAQSELILDENGDPIELTTTTTVNTVVGDDGFTTTTTTIETERYINGEVTTSSTTTSEKTPTDPRNITTTEVTEAITQSSTDPSVFLKTVETVTTTVDIEAGITTTTTVVDTDYEVAGTVSTQTTTSTTQEAFEPTELNKTDVSTVKTYASRRVYPATITTTTFENDSFPDNFVGINGNFFFTAQSSALYSIESATSDIVVGGRDLWFSDGTEGGTRPISVNQNSYSYYEPEDGEYTTSQLSQPEFGFKTSGASSFPRELTPAKNRLYFVANDGNTGFELWRISDQGTDLSLISDLSPGNTGSSPEDLTVIGETLYFSADEGNGRALYYYEPSFSKPKLVNSAGQNPDHLTAIGKKLYFSAESDLGRELWSAKGDTAQFVKDINPGSESSNPDNFTMTKRVSGNSLQRKKGKYLYFSADDGIHGNELMSLKLKGKGGKVKLESDINSGPRSSLPRDLTVHDQRLFFTANKPSKGRELWTVGPSIQGPTGEAGASTTETIVSENKKFVYQFSSKQSEPTSWSISGGEDASLFKINSSNGKLTFRQAPDFEQPLDQSRDNTYELFVRSKTKKSGYKADQEVLVKVTDIQEDSDPEVDTSDDEILYYTEDCGPITANGPLYPCELSGTNGSGSSSNNSSNGQILPPSNLELTPDGRTNYNEYNERIDKYEETGDCDWAGLAKTRARFQLENENDATLAEDWNRNYANECNLSEIII